MKKLLKICIIMVTCIVILGLLYYSFKYRKGIDKYMTAKQQHIELADAKSVDSLLNRIKLQEDIIEKIDSIYIGEIDSIAYSKERTIRDLKEQIKTKDKIIERQNQIIYIQSKNK